jgi:pimeloyl-ACP methyl ester carboxylesterase
VSEITENYVQLSHGRTRYLEAGSGEPMILLHGVNYIGGGDSFAKIIPLLAERYRVIAPDFIGWGYGDTLNIPYSFAYLVDFVRELQDALGLERSHIVGHSMGGWVATLFAYESPNRVDKLVLVAPGGATTRTLSQMTEFEPPTREHLEKLFAVTEKLSGAELEAKVAEAVRKTEVPGRLEAYRMILSHMNEPLTRQRYNTLRRLPLIKMPTLVVWGRQDKINAPELGEQIQAGLPHSRLVWIDDCGHSVQAEHPAELSAAIREFVN